MHHFPQYLFCMWFIHNFIWAPMTCLRHFVSSAGPRLVNRWSEHRQQQMLFQTMFLLKLQESTGYGRCSATLTCTASHKYSQPPLWAPKASLKLGLTLLHSPKWISTAQHRDLLAANKPDSHDSRKANASILICSFLM